MKVCSSINEKLGKYLTPCVLIGALLLLAILWLLRGSNTIVLTAPIKATKEGFEAPSWSDYPAVFTMYKVDWCPHCKAAAPEWNAMKESIQASGMPIKVQEIDGDQNPEACKKAGVQGFPTMVLEKGDLAVKYTGPRDAESLIKFAVNVASNPPVIVSAPPAAPAVPVMPAMGPSMGPISA